MKEFINFMEADLRSENFTKRECLIYGVIAPLVFVAVIGFCGWLF